MSVHIGPMPIVNDGLLLNYDASSSLNYTLSEVEVLVVAGGGGGGTGGGGGGAGGLLYSNAYKVTPGTPISVTVGNGGGNTSTWGGAGGAGQNSVFGDLTAIGGGAGNHRAGSPSTGTGGSGGGDAGGSGYTLDNGTIGQGFPGGNSPEGGTTDEEPGGGGGGAGGPGRNAKRPLDSGNASANSAAAGAGGPGLPFSISGSLRYYAGGGGGSNRNGVGQPGGVGGGGFGGASPTAGAPNTGGGGGGTGYSGYGGGGTSAVGGSGIVIVRYAGPRKANGGNTITNVGGYTIHTFTSSGTFTPFSPPSNATTIYGLYDLSGNNNHGYTEGTVTYYTDGGGSVSGNGTVGSGTIISSKLYGSDRNSPKTYSFSEKGITFEVWFKTSLSDPHEGVYSGLIDWNDSTLSLGTYTPDANPNQFRSWINNGGSRTTEFTVNSNTPNYFDTWHHVVLSYDYSLSIVKGYWDNSLIFTQNKGGLLETSLHPFIIGDREWPSHGYSFGGRIAIARVYNKGLSSNEVSQNFNAQRGRFGR